MSIVIKYFIITGALFYSVIYVINYAIHICVKLTEAI